MAVPGSRRGPESGPGRGPQGILKPMSVELPERREGSPIDLEHGRPQGPADPAQTEAGRLGREPVEVTREEVEPLLDFEADGKKAVLLERREGPGHHAGEPPLGQGAQAAAEKLG